MEVSVVIGNNGIGSEKEEEEEMEMEMEMEIADEITCINNLLLE